MQKQLDSQKGEASSPYTYYTNYANLKKGDYVMLNDQPCRIDMMGISNRKHSVGNNLIIAFDIFSGKKYDQTFSMPKELECPFIKLNQYQLIDIATDDYITILLESNEIREDLMLPKNELELVENIKADFANKKEIIIQVISAMGQEKVISYRIQC